MRLFALQVLNHGLYQQLAENQHQLFKTLVPARGSVFVQEGQSGKTIPVITNVEKDFVYAVPPEIAEKEKLATMLAPVLEMPKSEILAKISDNERKWVVLKKELPESTSEKIKNFKLKGVYLDPETYRFYPEKDFASQVLGFLAYKDNQRVGQYGIEESYEKLLAGRSGSLELEKDTAGRWIIGGTRKLEPAVDGADVVLTIDRGVQFKAEDVLENTVKNYQADSGSIVVLSPETGKVLAIANYPDFDPNVFGKVPDPKFFRDSAASDTYEPGSVFKAFTMAAGLDSGAVTPDMTYEDTGSVTLDDFVIRNANNKVFGVKNMTEVLEQSINTGAIFVQQRAGNENFLKTVKNFGFGEATGLTLPAESPGDIKNLIRGGKVHYATAAFGQGITVTPLQLAAAYGAIANQGKLMKPYIVERINYPDGRTENFVPQEVRQAISPKAANTLAAMLVSVVEKGHGKRAGVPGYFVAGKTGTAQVARSDSPGYDPDVTIGSFAGFAPVDKPVFVIIVKINNPRTVRFAESTAAPAFGEMARFLLNYLQIPPTR